MLTPCDRILEKLADLDLKDEVERMEEWVRDTFDGLPCMKEPKALTDRGEYCRSPS